MLSGSGQYEVFAFGASSIVAAVGGVTNMNGLGDVFDADNSQDLTFLSGRFNIQNTGHSAQFVHSFLDVQGYWRELYRAIRLPPSGG
jgi:hypothetical protein